MKLFLDNSLKIVPLIISSIVAALIPFPRNVINSSTDCYIHILINIFIYSSSEYFINNQNLGGTNTIVSSDYQNDWCDHSWLIKHLHSIFRYLSRRGHPPRKHIVYTKNNERCHVSIEFTLGKRECEKQSIITRIFSFIAWDLVTRWATIKNCRVQVEVKWDVFEQLLVDTCFLKGLEEEFLCLGCFQHSKNWLAIISHSIITEQKYYIILVSSQYFLEKGRWRIHLSKNFVFRQKDSLFPWILSRPFADLVYPKNIT